MNTHKFWMDMNLGMQNEPPFSLSPPQATHTSSAQLMAVHIVEAEETERVEHRNYKAVTEP